MNDEDAAANSAPDAAFLRDLLGHLNFTTGPLDPAVYQRISELWSQHSGEDRLASMTQQLTQALDDLESSEKAFGDCRQARSVIALGWTDLLKAYRKHHADLLFHLSESDFEQPFFLAALLEAVVLQGEPWEDRDRILEGALRHLNDFVGYRPTALLENGRRMEPYPHEKFRPIPIYLADAGVAHGPYRELVTRTLELLEQTPPDLLVEAHFRRENLVELACDVRAHDHLHPVNKRTNYMFGEWDPHSISVKGVYQRFVVRKIILDALVQWIDDPKSRVAREERLFDAAAALCGTMLMASSISGVGPETHDSNVSLSSLLPIVARRRDAFYQRLMEQVDGPRRKRLLREERKTQQPFGHVRQFLNMHLAGYGARQVQHRELAHLYASMGYAEPSRGQAAAIPAVSIRFESEIECTIAAAHQELDQEHLEQACAQIVLLPDLLRRGVECGGLVDPWNILGFHGHFPLFTAREDSIPDNRIETLLDLMEAIFGVYARALGEAAAQGNGAIRERVSVIFQSLAEWWDRFGSDAIEDLPDVSGQESWESANLVSSALTEWRAAGESAGDISFWRGHVGKFQSAQAYAQVVTALLEKRDTVAAMGLLMQWLSQIEDVGYECSQQSIFSLLIRWMKLVTSEEVDPKEGVSVSRAEILRKMFDFLEANADEWWSVPTLDRAVDFAQSNGSEALDFSEFEDEVEEDESDPDNIFGAAYDEMVFRDSAEDGNWGDTLENDYGFRNTEFEIINREMEPRLKFINVVGQLWQMSAARLAAEGITEQLAENIDEATVGVLADWHRQAQRWQIDVAELMESVWDHEIAESTGDHDANVEYDIQLQVKFYLLHQIINTLICLRNAERLLNGCLPDYATVSRGSEQDRQLANVYRAVVRRDATAVRDLMPALLGRLERNQLLYVPFDHGGDPGQVLRAQALQSVVRFLLRELPKLGLLRETWHLLYTAFRMERKWRPQGQAITEFDRLFDVALRSTLEALVGSARTWGQGDELDTEELIDAISKVLDPYQWIWSEHSRTMRISAVDGLRKEEEWEELFEFIRTYGSDLFHASQLTLGNVRAILHNGVDWYLDYLEEEQDPLHPIKLLDDLDRGVADRDDAEWCLEQIYSIIVDRFDRFLEYNTTTTQSDYGEMIFCLLEFLRLEARYDRDAWNLTPLTLVHETLARHGLIEAAEVWESTFELQTSDIADQHLEALERLQKTYGMRMPAVMDHLRERFVKPLAVNRMLALVQSAMHDARSGLASESEAFEALQTEVDNYLQDSWGSGVDIPGWLRQLEREVGDAARKFDGGRPASEAELSVAPLTISREEFQRQARVWRQPLGSSTRGSSGRSTRPNRRGRRGKGRRSDS